MKSLKDFKFKNKRVLVRCDFNVPLSDKGVILDDFRIRETLPTIQYLLQKRAKVILMSHLGRPEGKKVLRFSLALVQQKLLEYLDVSIVKAPDCMGDKIEKRAKEMQPGEILLLENLRFHKEEEENSDSFARALAKLGDIYVNDAFSVSHRKHASIVGVPKYLPSCAGLLLEKEVRVLTGLLENPKKPLVAIIGGSKVETKAKLINKLSKVADFVLVGGLIQKEIQEKGIKLDFPDKIIGPMDEKDGGKDIGPKTIKEFKEKIALAKTIFSNGPLGMTEKKEYSFGTKSVLEAVARSRAFSVTGGGETIEFITSLGLLDKFSHISTGGGAMISLLGGEMLPGIEVLKDGGN